MLVNPKGFIFGIHAAKPPSGFPEGKLRFRMRGDDFVKARVLTSDGIKEFAVLDDGKNWIPGCQLAENKTA